MVFGSSGKKSRIGADSAPKGKRGRTASASNGKGELPARGFAAHLIKSVGCAIDWNGFLAKTLSGSSTRVSDRADRKELSSISPAVTPSSVLSP